MAGEEGRKKREEKQQCYKRRWHFESGDGRGVSQGIDEERDAGGGMDNGCALNKEKNKRKYCSSDTK